LTTDEELSKNTARKPQEILNGPVTLVKYDPLWELTFNRQAERIRAVLGSIAQRVEHVGSTSVPGLIAKPIVDMLLVLPDSKEESSYVSPLETLGYTLRIREPAWYEHRLLKHLQPDVNLHVFSEGCKEVERMIVFRDWLRKNPDDLDLYAKTKAELASRNWKTVQNYADAKSEVIESIMRRAH
jgi:GrpB-like predicted nucleotidyltransferase (UPF0157 family)